MDTVIFLGAGAGKADGVPLQTELFQTFFDLPRTTEPRNTLADHITSFFSNVFGRDAGGAPGLPMPTFEEALGVLDLAILRNEGVKGLITAEGGLGNITVTRRNLILGLAAVLDRPSVVSTNHSILVSRLRDQSLLQRVAFVTTNYDTLLDDAIDAEAVAGARGTGSVVDYGFENLNPTPVGVFEEPRRFLCLKIHGSLNWLLCPVCDKLDVTYDTNGATRLVDDQAAARCLRCETLRTPVIVPPSYYKDLSNVHLGVVWNKTSQTLQAADHIIFCGYSFPDADIHIKYLLKRSELNRDRTARPLQITLVNNYTGKSHEEREIDFRRYSRFFGAIAVHDSDMSFEEFAGNPSLVFNSTG